MTPPVLTAFYAGLAALWLIYMTMAVVRLRRRLRVAHGDGGHKELARAIRGQANAAEQIPLALILIGLAEMLGAPGVAIHVLGLMLVVGRVLHGLHFLRVLPHQVRPVGMVLTVLCSGVAALGLIFHALTQMG